MRENARQKADRYLLEGRLAITTISDRHGGTLRATARGDGSTYTIAWEPHRGWTCTCPARTDQCCHLRAVRRVVSIDLNGTSR